MSAVLPADLVSIAQAFGILFPTLNQHAVAKRLNDAIVTGEAHLWLNGEQIDPDFLPRFFERHLRISATRDAYKEWTAEMSMIAAVDGFATATWMMSRAEVTALLGKMRPKKHAGGAPRIYDHDDIRAAAFVVLARFVKNGAIPDAYSANDLAGDVAALMLDDAPGDTLLGKILDPLLPRIKSRLNNTGR